MRGGSAVSRWRDGEMFGFAGAANAAAPRGVVYFEGVSESFSGSRCRDNRAVLYEARTMEVRRQLG
jgi:hypothetical protein